MVDKAAASPRGFRTRRSCALVLQRCERMDYPLPFVIAFSRRLRCARPVAVAHRRRGCIPMLAPLRTACDACHTFRYLTIMEQSSMSAPPTHTTATLRRLIFAYWRSNERATASALLLGVLALTL